ncbi:ankyrin repeat domain-containing protein 17-like [Schistocerca gregaria]|uniref:ankyrin repeat domain-containing protein 17-like n=1 Tax=Schistocerca gregaria TaxID=7010 RepID=UPI00211F2D8A|nr:ankyrin repeat domain-containing protein 17-like [Schistocerca gregaria]
MEAVKGTKETTAVGIGALLDAGDCAMVILVAGDTRLVVHRAVLADRSPMFAAMFRHDTLEASSGKVNIEDVGGAVLRELVSYLYTLQVPQLPGMAQHLLVAADKYGVSRLKAECERQVAAQLTVETAAAAAVLAVRHSCSDLRHATLAFIKTCPFEVMATQGWADAMLNQPKDLIQVCQLLNDPPPQTSVPAATSLRPTTTTTTAAGAPCQSPATAVLPTYPPLDEATVSQMRSISAEERDDRLFRAADGGAVEEVRVLLAAGANVEAREGGCGWEGTPLHCAAQEGHVEVARCLLDAGAVVDARDEDQRTPMHFAAENGHTLVVQMLLEASADPNATDLTGRTPLLWAASRDHTDVAALLLAAGAERGSRTVNGRTALHFARGNNNRRLVEMLS